MAAMFLFVRYLFVIIVSDAPSRFSESCVTKLVLRTTFS